jgi:hypothetical protein
VVAETGRLLRHIADSLQLAVLVTNHVVGSSYGAYGSRDAAGRDNTGTGGQQGRTAGGAARLGPGDVNYNFKPALGEQWRGLPHTRLQLSRAPAADVMCATLLASSIKVCSSASVHVRAEWLCLHSQGLPHVLHLRSTRGILFVLLSSCKRRGRPGAAMVRLSYAACAVAFFSRLLEFLIFQW